MTIEEIQQVLRTLHRDSQERATPLREMRRRLQRSDDEMLAIFAEFQSRGLRYAKPGPGRTALTLAGFSDPERRQIEAYAERLADEARALLSRLRRVAFASEAEAVKAGYRKARNCP